MNKLFNSWCNGLDSIAAFYTRLFSFTSDKVLRFSLHFVIWTLVYSLLVALEIALFGIHFNVVPRFIINTFFWFNAFAIIRRVRVVKKETNNASSNSSSSPGA